MINNNRNWFWNHSVEMESVNVNHEYPNNRNRKNVDCLIFFTWCLVFCLSAKFRYKTKEMIQQFAWRLYLPMIFIFIQTKCNAEALKYTAICKANHFFYNVSVKQYMISKNKSRTTSQIYVRYWSEPIYARWTNTKLFFFSGTIRPIWGQCTIHITHYTLHTAYTLKLSFTPAVANQHNIFRILHFQFGEFEKIVIIGNLIIIYESKKFTKSILSSNCIT